MELFVLACEILDIIFHLFILQMGDATGVRFDSLSELLYLGLKFAPVVTEVRHQCFQLLDLGLLIHINRALPDDILDELIVVALLNEGFQVLRGSLCHSVEVNEVVLRLRHILHQNEVLSSECDGFALFDDVVPPCDLVSLHGLLEELLVRKSLLSSLHLCVEFLHEVAEAA